MVKVIRQPVQIESAGNKPKIIREHVGRVRTETEGVSIAHMQSPGGWMEPGQEPEFTEYTVVLRGLLKVETRSDVFEIHAGEAIIAYPGEWIRYSSPEEGGAEYIAVCTPAFSPDTVHRDDEDVQG